MDKIGSFLLTTPPFLLNARGKGWIALSLQSPQLPGRLVLDKEENMRYSNLAIIFFIFLTLAACGGGATEAAVMPPPTATIPPLPLPELEADAVEATPVPNATLEQKFREAFNVWDSGVDFYADQKSNVFIFENLEDTFYIMNPLSTNISGTVITNDGNREVVIPPEGTGWVNRIELPRLPLGKEMKA